MGTLNAEARGIQKRTEAILSELLKEPGGRVDGVITNSNYLMV